MIPSERAWQLREREAIKIPIPRLILCPSGLLQGMKPLRLLKGQARCQRFCGALSCRGVDYEGQLGMTHV